MQPIQETCEICKKTFDGFDNGVTLEYWPDGTFLTPMGPWVCQDCIPDGWKMNIRKSIPEAIFELKKLSKAN